MKFIDITSESTKDFLTEAPQWVIDAVIRQRFFAVGAMEEETPVGALVYTIRRADEGEGNLGVLYHLSGDDEVIKALLDEYRIRSQGLGADFTITETTDPKHKDLLISYGFDMKESESINLEFKLSDLAKIPGFKKIEIPPTICPLSQISPIEFRYFLEEYKERVDLNPYYDIEATPMEWYDSDISVVSITEDGIEGAFLLRHDGKDTIMSEILAGFGSQFGKKIPYLLALSVTNAGQKYMPDTKVIIRRDGRKVAEIAEKILNGMKGEKAYYGVLMESGSAVL